MVHRPRGAAADPAESVSCLLNCRRAAEADMVQHPLHAHQQAPPLRDLPPRPLRSLHSQQNASGPHLPQHRLLMVVVLLMHLRCWVLLVSAEACWRLRHCESCPLYQAPSCQHCRRTRRWRQRSSEKGDSTAAEVGMRTAGAPAARFPPRHLAGASAPPPPCWRNGKIAQ